MSRQLKAQRKCVSVCRCEQGIRKRRNFKIKDRLQRNTERLLSGALDFGDYDYETETETDNDRERHRMGHRQNERTGGRQGQEKTYRKTD